MKWVIPSLLILWSAGCAKNEPNSTNPQLVFSKLVSDGNTEVVEDVALFLTSKQAYKRKYKDNLEYHGYEAPFDNEFDFSFVIVESLKAHRLATVVDWREDPRDVVSALNEITDNRLSQCERFDELNEDFIRTNFNISYYLNADKSESVLKKCVNDVGLKIISIDNGTDSYVLTLVDENHLSEIVEYAKRAKINLSVGGDGAL